MSRATLDAMALPFQQKVQDLLAEDGQSVAVLKSGLPRISGGAPAAAAT